jgi:hypothetical protein
MLKRYASATASAGMHLPSTEHAERSRLVGRYFRETGSAVEARAEVAEVLRIELKYSIDRTERRLRSFRFPKDAEHFLMAYARREWSRHQLKSQLSVGFHQRVGSLKGRLRRITMVALARQLLIGLWRYLETAWSRPALL